MFQGRTQICVGCRPPPTLPDRRIEGPKSFLLFTIIVASCLVSGLFPSLNKGQCQRVLTRTTRNMKWPITAAPIRITAMSTAVPAFHPLEVRHDVRERPPLRTAFRPMIIVHRMATHVDHAVNGGRTTNHLATRCDEFAPIKMRLRFCFHPPIVHLHIHGIGQCRWHLNQRTTVPTAVFDHEHVLARLSQTIGHCTTCRTSANDNVISLHQNGASTSVMAT